MTLRPSVLRVLLITFFCGSAAVNADPMPTAAEALIATDRGFAIAAKDMSASDALSSQFADDVIMPIRGKGFAKGKAAAIEALEADPDTANAHVEWTPLGVGVSADGLQGFTFGFIDEHASDGKQTPLKYLAYWRRADSGWKVIAYKRGKRAEGPIDTKPRPALLPTATGFDGARAKHGGALERGLADAERAFSDDAQKVGLEAAFARFGTIDSMNLGGSGNAGFVFGAEAIGKLVGGGEPEHGSSVSWAADERVVVAGSGDLGLSIGTIRFNQRADDGSERTPIPFFTVWRRAAPDQPWRYIAE